MTKDLVQIIYLNGPSSSGKTSIAKGLQDSLEEPFLHVGIDKIIGWMPEKINDWTGGEAPLGYSWKKRMDETGNLIPDLQVGPFAQKIQSTFHEVILALAKMGHHIIIDDVSFGKQQVDEWKELLNNFSVLWVGENAPLSVLERSKICVDFTFMKCQDTVDFVPIGKCRLMVSTNIEIAVPISMNQIVKPFSSRWMMS